VGSARGLLITTLSWGAVLWVRAARKVGLRPVEVRQAASEITKIVLLCAAAAFLVGATFPTTLSWALLIAKGLACVALSALALWLLRPQFRQLVREEAAHLTRFARLSR